MPISKGNKILDIGCGLGGPARYYAKKFECFITGIDITAFDEKIDIYSKTYFTHKKGNAASVGNGEIFQQRGVVSQALQRCPKVHKYAGRKKGSFFAFTEHGLGPLGDPIFPLPWADSDRINPYQTGAEYFGKLSNSTDIEIIKLMIDYKNLPIRNLRIPPTLGIHVIGGPSMIERSKNSLKSIKEKRTLPFEVLCKK